MERHKPPAGALDVKLGPGGLVDLEFAVHVLQLTSHVGLDPRLEVALAELAEAGLIDAKADRRLAPATRMLVMMRLVAPEGDRADAETLARAGRRACAAHADWARAACRASTRRATASANCGPGIRERMTMIDEGDKAPH